MLCGTQRQCRLAVPASGPQLAWAPPMAYHLRRPSSPRCRSTGCMAAVSLPSQASTLPPLQQCKHFVNLTNGIEAIPTLDHLDLPFSFVRIQSTACEQQKFEGLMMELDANLLMSLALGHCCLVYDFGSRNKSWGVPRAIWYGLEFTRYALTRLWLPDARPETPYVRGYNTSKHFDGHIAKFSQSTKRRLRYYSKWLPPSVTQLRLHGVYSATVHDKELDFYRPLLHQCTASETPLLLRQPQQLGTLLMTVPACSQGPSTSDEVSSAEASLQKHGLRMYYRGLSPSEYAAAQKCGVDEEVMLVGNGSAD